MGFRDENEALRARIRSLEGDNQRLEDEKEAAEEQLKAELSKVAKTKDRKSPPRNERLQAFMRGEGGDDLESLFGGEGKNEHVENAHANRSPRVTCSKIEDGEIVHVRKQAWRDTLKSGWAVVPAVGLGAVLGCIEGGVPLPWTLGLAVATCAIALAVVISPPSWRLELWRNRFKLFRNDGSKPVVEGSMDELSVRIRSSASGTHHAEIGLLGEDDHCINKLSRSDAYRLRDALERAGKKRTM